MADDERLPNERTRVVQEELSMTTQPPENQFPWYARILGWILERIFGKDET
jgi:hypothetical protein